MGRRTTEETAPIQDAKTKENDIFFAEGMVVREPHKNAPQFIQLELSIKVSEFIETLKEHEHNQWVNITVKESKAGKLYAQINEFRPEPKG